MSIEMPSVLRLLSGSPLEKAKTVMAEKLKVTKSMDVGNLSGIMQTVLGGNISSVAQNFMAPLAAQAQTAIAAATSTVSGVTGVGSLLSGLSGLNTQLTNLTAMTSQMLSPAGVMDIVSHGNILGDLGSAVPSNLSLANLLAPLNVDGFVAQMQTQVTQIAAQVQGGTMTVADATTAVSAMTTTLSNAMTASASATSAMNGAIEAMTSVNALASALVTGPQAVKNILEKAVPVPVKAAIREANAEQIRP